MRRCSRPRTALFAALASVSGVGVKVGRRQDARVSQRRDIVRAFWRWFGLNSHRCLPCQLPTSPTSPTSPSKHHTCILHPYQLGQSHQLFQPRPAQ